MRSKMIAIIISVMLVSTITLVPSFAVSGNAETDTAYSNNKFKTWDKIYTSFPSSKKYVKITAVWKWHGGHKTYYPTGKMTAKYVNSK